MNFFTKLTAVTLLPVSLFSGTIYFNNGAVLEGDIIGQNEKSVTIVVKGQKTTYGMKDITKVENEAFAPPPPPPPAPLKTDTKSVDTIPSGTVLHLVTTEPITTRTHTQGSQFKMALESDLYVGGNVVARKGSIVYAVVTSAQQAGRLVGKSSLVVTLQSLEVNGRRIPIQTQSLNILTLHGQARDTVGKTVRAAAIGGLINGKSGARNGAKVGVGAAVLTRGQAAGVNAGTLLDFALTADAKLH